MVPNFGLNKSGGLVVHERLKPVFKALLKLRGGELLHFDELQKFHPDLQFFYLVAAIKLDPSLFSHLDQTTKLSPTECIARVVRGASDEQLQDAANRMLWGISHVVSTDPYERVTFTHSVPVAVLLSALAFHGEGVQVSFPEVTTAAELPELTLLPPPVGD